MMRFKNIFFTLSLVFFQCIIGSQVLLEPTEEEDAFAWQNNQHYQETIKKFSTLAEKEYGATIESIINFIDKSESFFKERHKFLLSSLQETIFYWMKEDVLTEQKFDEENKELGEAYEGSEAEEFPSDEDAWRISFMEGYDRDFSSDKDEPKSYSEDDPSWTQSMSLESDEHIDSYQEWQLDTIKDMLGLEFNSLNEFTEKSITMSAITRFLTESVQDNYSWLINEKIGGSLLTGDDFSHIMHKTTSVDKEILLEIMEGLWFDYDWEQYDISDPLYIAKTYKAALTDLKSGRAAKDLKKYVLESITKLFTYNNNHFNEAFASLKNNYNRFVKQRNWLAALVEWAVYCVYRRQFAQSEALLKTSADKGPLLPMLKKINTNAGMLSALKEERERATKEYKKVYLHQTVTKLTYTDQNNKAALLDMNEHFSMLKAIGASYEEWRPGAENVFVPQLFIIVQEQDDDAPPQFIEIPLLASECKLNQHPLSCYGRDAIFPHGPNDFYYARAKEDYVNGSVIQGKSKHSAEQEITQKITSKAARSTELVHSERVVMELFRTKKFTQHLVKKLASKLPKGHYYVHRVVMLGYSTNCVCPQCTPTLIALMNSHEEGQFLHMLATELSSHEGNSIFYLPESDDYESPTDWTQFRMNIFVTASTVFDCQSRFSTEEEQYKGTKYPMPAQNKANRHAKLYRPNNTFELCEIPQKNDGGVDPYQRFFYEFVGDTIHTTHVGNNYKDRLVFTSGGSKGPWNKK